MTKTMDYNGNHLVYKENEQCKTCPEDSCEYCCRSEGCNGCFFEDEPGCPDCRHGIWVEEVPEKMISKSDTLLVVQAYIDGYKDDPSIKKMLEQLKDDIESIYW